MNNPYESFYHGLVVSKLWLCEELEKIIDANLVIQPNVNILGGWHNLMGFMMLIRRPKNYNRITSFDKDESSTKIADMICDMWKIEQPIVTNITQDVLTMDFSKEEQNTLFINCSVDQFISSSWYDSIPNGNIVCMQTTDIIDEIPPWEINQRTKDLVELKNRYPMSEVLFEGTKNISYPNMSYNRLMLIGRK